MSNSRVPGPLSNVLRPSVTATPSASRATTPTPTKIAPTHNSVTTGKNPESLSQPHDAERFARKMSGDTSSLRAPHRAAHLLAPSAHKHHAIASKAATPSVKNHFSLATPAPVQETDSHAWGKDIRASRRHNDISKRSMKNELHQQRMDDDDDEGFSSRGRRNRFER